MKVALVDYIGYGDRRGEPVGHTLKILKEYAELVNSKYKVEYIVSREYSKKLEGSVVKVLPFFSDTTKRGKSRFENMKTLIKSFLNIHYAFKHSEADVIWFCNVDQFLFMYLGIFGFHRKKVVVTTFSLQYPKRYHNYFLNKVRRKIKLFITSNELFKQSDNTLFIPDYFYIEEKYAPYAQTKREDKIVSLGTMGRAKKISEIMDLCKVIEYPYEIRGFFYEQSFFEELMQNKSENIIIANEYLAYDDYLKTLGKVKFCFFNYDKEAYANITSGVILECVFMGCVPIANEFLLKNMGLYGIGYNDIADIEKIDLYSFDTAQIVNINNGVIKERYEKQIIVEQLLQRFSWLEDESCSL